MAKKKLKINKLTAKKFKKYKKDKRLLRALPAVGLMVGVGVGLLIAWLQPPDLHPQNVVWAADKTVSIPADLAEFLAHQDDCQSYKGTNSPRGVGLWSVYQVSKATFAKVSYGCSTHLNLYIMAVKDAGSWKLLPPTEYFASRTASSGPVSSYLPRCDFIEQYKIDKPIEPFCVAGDGVARENTIK